jgi:hypothetical protein
MGRRNGGCTCVLWIWIRLLIEYQEVIEWALGKTGVKERLVSVVMQLYEGAKKHR